MNEKNDQNIPKKGTECNRKYIVSPIYTKYVFGSLSNISDDKFIGFGSPYFHWIDYLTFIWKKDNKPY